MKNKLLAEKVRKLVKIFHYCTQRARNQSTRLVGPDPAVQQSRLWVTGFSVMTELTQ